MTAALLICVAAVVSLAAMQDQAVPVEAQLLLTHIFVDEELFVETVPEGYEPAYFAFDRYLEGDRPGNLRDAFLVTGTATATVVFGGGAVREAANFVVVLLPVKEIASGESTKFLVHTLAIDNPLLNSILSTAKSNPPALEMQETVLPNGQIAVRVDGALGEITWQQESRSIDSAEYTLPLREFDVLLPESISNNEATLIIDDGSYLRAVFRDKNLRELIESLQLQEFAWESDRCYQIRLRGHLQ